MKNFIFYFLTLSLIYLEIIFKALNSLSIIDISTLFISLLCIIISSLICLILNIFKQKGKFITVLVLLSILPIYFSANTCLHNMYKFYFQMSSLSMIDQVAAFAGDGLKVVLNNWLIILFFVPLILLIVLRKYINDKSDIKLLLISCLISLIMYLPFALDDYGYVYKTFASNNMIQVVNKNGVISGFCFDVGKAISGDKSDIEVIEDNIETSDDEIEYGYNAFDIDYEALNSKINNPEIAALNSYVANKTPTKKNKYTSFFEGKNLILFMAESFNGICIDPDLTPTLYKLANNGFAFSNFYSPTIYSTIGGEFSELTSLLPELGDLPNTLSIFRSNSNTYPMGIGNLFYEKGYKTYGYHNSTYDFQDRNVYLNSLGFKKYNACGLGLENDIDCNHWPASDVDMINATFNDYINDDNFLVFYATVSGHGPYLFDSKENVIAPKYEEMLKEYYKDKLGTGKNASLLMAYEAGQIELDKALQTLIEKLQAAGKLDDTVIALVGDHHPYYLTEGMSMDDYNKLSTYERDEYIELYHSNFILYNSAMETVKIDKVGSQLDVIPTIYNLFGIDYDSRLLLGNDLLSTTSSIAIMADNSWINDYGRYYASNGKYIANDGMDLGDSYVDTINKKVSNMFKISRMIMRNNYYQFIYDNK